MKVVFVQPDRCLGCRNCERVCSFHDSGGFKRGDTNIWVHIDLDQRSISTLTCQQCDTALCLEVCPSAALGRDPETGAVVVDETACVGCKMCVHACPFGCIHFEGRRRVAAKCDLCSGNPKCVQNCIAHALHYGDINDLAAYKRERLTRS